MQAPRTRASLRAHCLLLPPPLLLLAHSSLLPPPLLLPPRLLHLLPR